MSVGTLSVACCTWVPCCLSAIQNIHYLCIRDLYKISLPLHQRAPTADQTDAAAVLRQNGNNQNAHMFNSDHTPALMLANLKTWVLPTRSAMLIDMAGVTSLPCPSKDPWPCRCATTQFATWTHVHANVDSVQGSVATQETMTCNIPADHR